MRMYSVREGEISNLYIWRWFCSVKKNEGELLLPDLKIATIFIADSYIAEVYSSITQLDPLVPLYQILSKAFSTIIIYIIEHFMQNFHKPHSYMKISK